MRQYKPSKVFDLVRSAYLMRRCLMLWGSPGIGKSSIIRQVADSLNIDMRDIRLPLLDPVDLRGIPQVINGVTHWCPPAFLPLAGAEGDRGGIVLFDEINSAPRMTQAGAYQITLDHMSGESQLSPLWSVVCAGNKSTDRAIVERMGTALESRMMHFELVADLDDWCAWANTRDIDVRVVSFLRFRPDLLHKFDPRSEDKSFPCPRTWEFSSDVLHLNEKKSTERALISGTVGEGAGGEFSHFLDVYAELPNIDELIADPNSANVPDDPCTLYALGAALVNHADIDNVDNITRYTLRMPDDFSVCVMTDLVKRSDEELIASLYNSSVFCEWAEKHHDVMFIEKLK